MNEVERQNHPETLVPDQLKGNEILNWDHDKGEWREGDKFWKRPEGSEKQERSDFLEFGVYRKGIWGEAQGVDRPITGPITVPNWLTVHDSGAQIQI